LFTFGDAGFFGSTGSVRSNRTVVGMARTGSGGGYWLVASDGAVLTFGDAELAAAGMAPTAAGIAAGGGDYVVVEVDGRVRVFHRPRVALFGDSLAGETNPHLAGLLDARRIELRFRGHDGAATCDFLEEMRGSDIDWAPDIVVIMFTGNALTPCITSRSGDPGPSFDIAAFEASYRDDTLAAIATFGAAVDVVLVGPPPIRTQNAANDVIDELYEQIAELHANVDHLSPDAFLSANGEYVDRLPCMPMEPCTPGEPVRVRADDGVHLCAPAPSFCFGGLRMGVAITGRVTQVVDESTRGGST
jgi:hypothetical protein